MSNQNRPNDRWQHILELSFVIVAAGLLFMATKANLAIFGFDILKPFGLILLALSLVLLFSSLGAFSPKKLGGFLSYMEKVMADLWLVVLVVSLFAIMAAWAAGRIDVQQNNWFYQPYLWSVPIWFIALLVVLLIVIVYHIYRSVKRDGWWRSTPRITGLLVIGVAVWLLTAGVQEGRSIQVIASLPR